MNEVFEQFETEVDEKRKSVLLSAYDELDSTSVGDPNHMTQLDKIGKLERIDVEKQKIINERVAMVIKQEQDEIRNAQDKEIAMKKIKSESRHRWTEHGLRLLAMGAYAGSLIWTTTLGYKFESNQNIFKSPTFRDCRNMFKRNPFK